MRWWARLLSVMSPAVPPVLLPVPPVLLPVMLPVLLTLLLGNAFAQSMAVIPALSGRVVDSAGLLSPTASSALERKLAAFEAQGGTQIVVLTLGSTAPEDIASYAQRVGDTWKIGRRQVGDGLLIVVAKDDRRVWIAPAKALEGAVPDLAAKKIIDRSITPAFKNQDYAAGLDAGIEALIARIRGEDLPAPQHTRDGSAFGLETLAMFFFVGVPIVGGLLTSVLGRKLGALATASATGALAGWLSASLVLGGLAAVVAWVVVGLLGIGSSGGRGGQHRSGPSVIWGGGGVSSGGGGFSSGGGGDFGGGGAGGNW
jgi:uncharacterized protein